MMNLKVNGATMLLIKNGEIYAPDPLGKTDILIGGGKILAMGQNINASSLPCTVDVIDAAGAILIPGFIDGHQHFTGGGGEGGFNSRVPEMQVSMNFRNGVTTAVGMLGTDSLTRTVESLYAKTQALNADGMSAYMLTGAYWSPAPTITGSISRDLVYLQPVIGATLALSDPRGPHLDVGALATIAADIQVAALVAAKAGIITVHTGIRNQALDLIMEAVEKYEIRPGLFVPTHINRKSEKLRTQVFSLAERGAVVDATCMPFLPESDSPKISAAEFAIIARDNGLLNQVTFSSDAGGSIPVWNADHSRITGMGVGTPSSLLFELNQLVNTKGMPLEQALLPLTTTPARIYGFDTFKGALRTGMDADIIVMDPSTFSIRDVIAKGLIAVRNGNVERKGNFE